MLKYSLLIVIIFLTFFSFGIFATSQKLLLATTTSVDNSGLLDYLAPFFTHDTNINLRWVAVGSGQAFEIGKHCNADALLTHAPQMEADFLHQDYASNITPIMYNDFVLIGPISDPAQIKNLPVIKALQKIAAKQALFVSRGDNSGTQEKEKTLWEKAHLNPQINTWYIESGQNMLATLNMVAEKHAYTLTDRATFIKFNQTTNKLTILVTDPSLRNQYSFVLLNKKHCPLVNYNSATIFKDWLLSARGQKLIGDFKIAGYNVFKPVAIN